jgi:hypothetical protein
MLTWEMVRSRLRTFLSDQVVEGRSPRVTEGELVYAWTDAQDDLVQYVARPATFTVAAALEVKMLPDDLYKVDYVEIDYGDDATHYRVLALDEYETGDVDVFEGTYWYLTHSRIVFTQALEYEVTVHYRQYYPAPVANEDAAPIHVPRWAISACTYYAAAQCLEKQAVKDPQLRQYANRQQDAGNPLHNPFLQVAKYLLERYRERVYERSQQTTGERQTWHSSYP